ncbi:wax ester/triacylglycerol synthase domain-containing protein [Actinophytocola sp.]|uniref:wax ester/triacylglycerol synthase domain-containing protein n=1 Tax=Actinophytocola sp. TaxID=1872138 RepID=UPI002ED5B49B
MGRLSGLDAAFLSLETRTRPMHLGAVAVFAGPVPQERLRTLLAERAARLPALRVAGSWLPSWWPASDFDPAAHVRGFEVRDRRTFDAYVAGWLATPLDLSRPPWDVHVVTGLPDDRFAVLVKLHHSLADGAGAVALAGALLDGGMPPVRSASPPRYDLGETAAMAGAVARAVRRPPVPALLASGGTARRVAFVRLDLADVRQIRRQHGGTTNDVVLAVLAGGLREWLRSRDAQVDGRTPRALIPVNTRARGGAGGNQLSGFLCDLPVSLADPVERLRAVCAAMNANKAAGPSRGAGTLPILANLLPSPVHRLCTGPVGIAAPLLFDTVVTNVPLPAVPLTIDGAPLDEIYPFGPLAPGHALGVAISPYRDTVHIGLQADRDAVPDIDVLANAISKSCTTLHELAN